VIDELRDDPVELLLPDASSARREAATRLTTALRLFASDALDSGSPSVHVQLSRAKDELEGHRVTEIRASLRDVLRHVAARCVSNDSYVTLAAPDGDYTSSWERLLDRLPREERRGLALDIPAPGADALASLRSLVRSLELFAARTGSKYDLNEVSLWSARQLAAAGDVEEAQALLEELLGRLASVQDSVTRAIRAEALTDVLALQLDAGRLDQAGDTVGRVGPCPARVADCVTPLHALVQITTWARGGDRLPRLDALFRQTLSGMPRPWREVGHVVLPDVVARTEDRTEDRGSRLSGATTHAPPAEAASGAALERRSVGAQALVVLGIGEDGRTRLVHGDVAPALAPGLDAWALRRLDAIVCRGTVEHDVVRTGAATALIRCAERDADGERIDRVCIDASVGAPRSIAVEPVHDGDEVVGLVWMEFAHRLLPSAARRRSIAQSAGARLGSAERTSISVRVVTDGAGALDPQEADARAELVATWTEVVRQVGLKTAERRWIAFDTSRGSEAISPVAAGGDGSVVLGDPTEEGAWAVRRALRTGGVVRYGEEDLQARSMLHAGAVTGAALALRHGSDVRSVLVIESARRGDAREKDVGRWYDRLQEHADRIECASVHRRDRVEYDGGFVTDIEAPDARARVGHLRAIARRRVDVLIRGEEGSGRRTAARWLAHARHKEPAVQRLVTLSGFGLEAERIGTAFERASAVVISDVDWLSPAAQAELTRQLMIPAPRRPALFATLSDPGASRLGSGPLTARADTVSPESKLHPDLLRRLERVSLRTTPLREARHEIPVLACFLARRFLCGQAEQRAPVSAPELVDDTALAGLWRQSWEGNVAALDGVLHAALLRVDGAPIHVDDVRDAIRDLGIDYVTRLPSRDPRAVDVASAAWTTRTATGRINKTRAALYLGWDPNTLSGRLRDLGIDDLDAAACILGEDS